MSISKLTFNNFRNLENTTLTLHSDINFFVGDNGSGKSSFLETLFYLGHGKSYRTGRYEVLIKHEEKQFIVSALNDDGKRFGVGRYLDSNDVDIRINGVKFNKLSDLVKNIAVQIITPESFGLFAGGPKERRKFVDLGMFHVKHQFQEQWKNFAKVLKQRNACLRQSYSNDQLKFWNDKFCEASKQIASLRNEYLTELKEELINWLQLLIPNLEPEISIVYLQGWNSKKELAEIIESNLIRERERGFSLYGAHRFDVRFHYKGKAIESFFSRGQQKLFLLALTFAQSKLIEKVKRVKPVLLIDDIGAELDDRSRTAFYNAISTLDCQLFITAIDEQALKPIIPNDNNYYMFHVKHGKISEISK
ncbi:DNA replication/repair protein RecF [Thalassotalea ganghwensis]